MFWERFCELCELNNCKPNTVAKAIGLSGAIATKWKNGAIPNATILVKIAEYFKVSVDYLLGVSDNKNKIITLDRIDDETTQLDYDNQPVDVPINIEIPDDKMQEMFVDPEKFYTLYNGIKNVAEDSGLGFDNYPRKGQIRQFNELYHKLNQSERYLLEKYMEFLISQREKGDS